MAQEHHSLTRLAVALTAALVLGGCRAPSPRTSLPTPTPNLPAQGSENPGQPAPNPPSQRAPQPPRENRLSPATSSIVTQARALMSRGDFDGASSTLDRALRIDANNPLLWIELGRLRLPGRGAPTARRGRAQ